MAGIKKAKTPALIHGTDMCAGPTVFLHGARGSGGATESPNPEAV